MHNVLDSKAFTYRGWDKGAFSQCINPQSFSSFAQNLLTEPSNTTAQVTLYLKHFPLFRREYSYLQNPFATTTQHFS